MILARTHGKVTLISLDRAEKRNAMLPEMLGGLRAAIEDARGSGAIVLVGEGKVFCAGFDLKACSADPGGGTMRALLSGLSGVILAMRASPAPVVLGVHGAAVAGGCALLGGADVVVADRGAKLGYPVVKIGVSPAVSAPFMLASMTAGRARARLVDTELISGERGREIGMVHELVDAPGEVRGRAMEIAVVLAAKPGIGVGETKEWLNEISASMTDHAQSGLGVSLGLTGGDEERARLGALWG